jgi:hypothetical protein
VVGEVFEANLAALMELIAADPGTTGDSPGDDEAHGAALLAAWQSFFLVVPVVQVPFETAGTLLDGLGPGARGWLLAADAEQLAADEVTELLQQFGRAVLAGDGTEPATHFSDRVVRYGTWLSAGSAEAPDDTESRWVGMPLRVVRGQDRITVDRRNDDLAYDGLLITGRE